MSRLRRLSGRGLGPAPGYVWTCSTPTTCYFHDDASRAKHVPDGILGEDFAGTLVTDFYGVYDHYLGPKRRCWSHLWRDIRALEKEHPADLVLCPESLAADRPEVTLAKRLRTHLTELFTFVRAPLVAPLTGIGGQSGTATLTVNPGQQEVCYHITISSIQGAVFAAHIHIGGAGVNGPIVVPLFNLSSPTTQSDFSGCVLRYRLAAYDPLCGP